MSEFSAKVALVTGGGSGIGEATALLFAERGAAVAVVDVDEAAARRVASTIQSTGGQALAVAANVAQATQVRAAVAQAVSHFGRLDALLNSAGISPQYAPVGDYPLEEWDRTLATNLSGTFYGMKYAIPEMLRHDGGAVVNISSIMGQVASPGGLAYCATKHGVIGLTKAAALDYGARGVRVNAIGPGVVETPMTAASITTDEMRQGLLAFTPLQRFAQAREIAELVIFLCSARASFITGAYYPIDGGYLAM
ncbi:MAG: SDR family NAD(P)-dependent oxidoreductase [Candidatus Binatia bacterium]